MTRPLFVALLALGVGAAAIKSYETALKLNPKRTAAQIRGHETTTAALAALR